MRRVKERMKRWDEISIIEELSIRSEDIIERFDDVIEDQVDRLEKVFFCSIATLRDKEIPSDDKARVDSAVDRLRYIFEKYKKFH